MNVLRFVFAIVLLTALQSTAEAQPQMRGMELGPWGGAAFYLGDLNTDFKFNRPNPAGGLAARFNFNHRLSAKVSFNYGKVEAYDSDSDNPFEQNRNLNFQSDIFDGTAQFEFNFLPYFHGHDDFFFTPYAFAGVSIFNYNPKTETDAGELVELRNLGTEGQLRGEEYLTLASALTYGIGLKWDLSYEWSLDASVGVRNANTDYLDDVSTLYPDKTDLIRSRGQMAYDLADRSLMMDDDGSRIDRAGEQRGDDTLKDRYIFVGIGLNYYFGDVRCPSARGKRR